MYLILKVNAVCFQGHVDLSTLHLVKSIQCGFLEFLVVANHDSSFNDMPICVGFIFNGNKCFLIMLLKFDGVFADMVEFGDKHTFVFTGRYRLCPYL